MRQWPAISVTCVTFHLTCKWSFLYVYQGLSLLPSVLKLQVTQPVSYPSGMIQGLTLTIAELMLAIASAIRYAGKRHKPAHFTDLMLWFGLDFLNIPPLSVEQIQGLHFNLEWSAYLHARARFGWISKQLRWFWNYSELGSKQWAYIDTSADKRWSCTRSEKASGKSGLLLFVNTHCNNRGGT